MLENSNEILDKIRVSIEENGREFTVKELRKGKMSFFCPNSLGLLDHYDDCREGYEHNCYNCWDKAL